MHECINDVLNTPGDVADVKLNPSFGILTSILKHFVSKFGKSAQKSKKRDFRICDTISSVSREIHILVTSNLSESFSRPFLRWETLFGGNFGVSEIRPKNREVRQILQVSAIPQLGHLYLGLYLYSNN